jgi:hypothetical protein
VNERILRLLKKKTRTTDELGWELRVARSTLMVALTRMKAEGIVCIADYKYTGATPAKLWGIGSVDAPRPATQTREQRNAQRREARRKEREKYRPFVPPEPKKSTARRDIAASWF